jgi:hypothetical protein
VKPAREDMGGGAPHRRRLDAGRSWILLIVAIAANTSADVARLDKSVEFAEVEKHVDTLIRNFRRVMFESGD